MGLDTYAARKLYTKQWEHQSPDERYTVQVLRGGKPVPGIQPERITRVEEEVMYWRKANHIHAWFVDNVQGGEDDCESYHVSWEKLRELRDACEIVMRSSVLVEGTIDGGTTWDKEHPNGVVRRIPGKVIDNPARAVEVLPRREGFFFGTYEYDEDYLTDVTATRDWAASMIADHEAGVPGDIYYSSSW